MRAAAGAAVKTLITHLESLCLQVSTAILATPQLAAWPSPDEAPPEVEISEHLLIEGPKVEVALTLFVR